MGERFYRLPNSRLYALVVSIIAYSRLSAAFLCSDILCREKNQLDATGMERRMINEFCAERRYLLEP